jgi:hypothetical protein
MRLCLPAAVWLAAVLMFAPAEGQTLQSQNAEPRQSATLQKAPDCLGSGACCCWCPNDYLRKPLPCIPGPACGGPNDYCRKPLPYVPPPVCGGPNDYCRKPLVGARPNCLPWYSCLPTSWPTGPKMQSAAPKASADAAK